jgi:chromosome segregation ATPase
MVQQVKHPDEAEADLGKPGELLSLDVASYAAGLASNSENSESNQRRISDTSWDESRPHTLAELPPIETLRALEAWFVAQDARTRTNNRVLAELQAARADAEARADSLALELDVAQKALHSALGRANDPERADFAATIDQLHDELAERDAAIAHLKAEQTTQSVALEELSATLLREQQSSAVRQEEVRAAAETLATEIQALEERYRRSAESIAAREAELAESRAARSALEETLRTVQINESAHTARVLQLEARATDLGHALQAQTEATERANASTATRERELADGHNRASALEAKLQAAMRHATDLSAAAQWTETELKMRLEQLAASQNRLANFEHEATYQSEWLANLQVELAQAEVLAEQADASRRLVENELGRVRTELQHERERANALDVTQRELALELGRVRTELQHERERANALDVTQRELALELGRVRTELQHERERANALDVTQRELALELGRVRTELQHESERANALDATQRELALELEQTRGTLDEREFQLRRLVRDAHTSAQALSRIEVGIERRNSDPLSETLEFPDDGATLVSLDDSDAPAVPLGRHTTIGRARESNLRLKDSSVSRRHAVVTIEPNGAFIEDLRSVNGVTVNGQRIRHARVTDGDVIELGVKRFRFTSSATGRNARNAM